jgi:hypothetical protein
MGQRPGDYQAVEMLGSIIFEENVKVEYDDCDSFGGRMYYYTNSIHCK